VRIAYLGSEGVPYPGAFAKITEEIGARLVDRGHEILVYGRRRLVPEATPYRGIARVPLPSWNSKHLDTITFSALSTLDLLRSGWADVAHFHGIGPAVLAPLPALRRTKSVVHVHALDWKRSKWGLGARLCLQLGEAAAVRFPTATVVVSRELQSYFEARHGSNVHYVPQGVDPPAPADPEMLGALGLEPRRYLLYMGRLVPEKGLHYLLEAFGRLSAAGETSLPLVVAGGGSHTDAYVRRIRSTASPRVMFLGHVDGRLKRELLSHAQLYVQPSEIEGLSLALLEAMSYGNAALVSDIPENLEAAGRYATSFQSGSADDLTEKLAAMLGSPDELRALGERARRYVLSTYSWDRVADEMEALYRRVLSGSEVAVIEGEGRPAR
jgi:glycosyltransferase involved in cell wall biosynthesis